MAVTPPSGSDACLAVPQVRGWRGFAQAEWWYMLLSLTSKQLLAWITYGGSSRFANEGN